jgi:hypothetical protein
LKQVVRGEFAENAFRKDFLPSEIEAIRRAIEPYERAAAKERQRKHAGTAPAPANTPGKFPQVMAVLEIELGPSPELPAAALRKFRPSSKRRSSSRSDFVHFLNQNGLSECAVSFEFMDRRLQVLPMIADLYVIPVEPQYGNRLPRRCAGAFRK